MSDDSDGEESESGGRQDESMSLPREGGASKTVAPSASLSLPVDMHDSDDEREEHAPDAADESMVV